MPGPSDFSLPTAKDRYTRDDFQAVLDYIRALEEKVFMRDKHVEIYGEQDSGGREPFLILRSPDGTRWKITVDNAGTISATDVGSLGL